MKREDDVPQVPSPSPEFPDAISSRPAPVINKPPVYLSYLNVSGDPVNQVIVLTGFDASFPFNMVIGFSEREATLLVDRIQKALARLKKPAPSTNCQLSTDPSTIEPQIED